jgi:GTP pyrophosphokinase
VDTVLRCPPALAFSIERARLALRDAGARDADLARGVEAAQIVGALADDEALALGTLTCGALGGRDIDAATSHAVGERAVRLARALAPLGDLGMPRDWQPDRGLDARQAETLRKMLLAVVSDPRLVLARLAIQLVALRAAREAPAPEQVRLGTETREIFAPLANRLGVWQLKWELEDLALRLLDPQAYKRIAAALNETRVARERYIEELCTELRHELAQAGVAAEVYGRPKHIYSIHRKMQRKRLGFEQIFDVRALRIVCADIPACYAALGIVHGRWRYIPGEFDDYIATPKGNDYRSIHTAVIGPGEQPVEVQIRTQDMHAQAELGVAAHWRYKEGGVRDAGYGRKIDAVRQLLAPHGAGEGRQGDDIDFIDRVQAELFTDRVYALTPKGEVVELPKHATPLDFAYHLHTDLGHRCRGAKVNGRIVPLTYQVANGEIIEVITAKEPAPSRDWMAPEQGYLASARNRSRVRAWFRRASEADNRAAGRASVDRELARTASGAAQLAALIQELKASDADTLYRHVGEGEITLTQLTQAITRLTAPPPARSTPKPRPAASGRERSPVAIEGIGDLPITLARCCAPVRPQSIVGYVTVGRGVTIHRGSCAGLRRMRESRPERVLECQWIEAHAGTQTVELTVVGLDRKALVRDLTDVIASERLRLDSLTTTTQRSDGTATTVLRVDVRDLADLARITQRLGSVPNVLSARRTA